MRPDPIITNNSGEGDELDATTGIMPKGLPGLSGSCINMSQFILDLLYNHIILRVKRRVNLGALKVQHKAEMQLLYD